MLPPGRHFRHRGPPSGNSKRSRYRPVALVDDDPIDKPGTETTFICGVCSYCAGLPLVVFAVGAHARRSGSGRATMLVLRPRLMPNSTAPAVLANKVSSAARRCRVGTALADRISPTLTAWPPYRPTPAAGRRNPRPLRGRWKPLLVCHVCRLRYACR